MKKYGIIPSRFGSSRFPGKPLAMLAGLTALVRRHTKGDPHKENDDDAS